MLPQPAQLPAIQAGQQVTVRVPATSANLGPGYDSLGLALTLHDTLTVESLDTGELVFELSGEGADSLPRDASHLVVRAMEAAFGRCGYRHTGLEDRRRKRQSRTAAAWVLQRLPWWPQSRLRTPAAGGGAAGPRTGSCS